MSHCVCVFPLRAEVVTLRHQLPIENTAVSVVPYGDIVPQIDDQLGVAQSTLDVLSVAAPGLFQQIRSSGVLASIVYEYVNMMCLCACAYACHYMPVRVHSHYVCTLYTCKHIYINVYIYIYVHIYTYIYIYIQNYTSSTAQLCGGSFKDRTQ